MNVSITSIVIGVAVLLYVLARQVQKRMVREDRRPTLILVLGIIGIIDVVDYTKQHPLNSTAILLTVVSLALAAGFGVLRAYTVRLWREDGQLWRQGNVLTILLWVVAIGIHFGGDFIIDSSAKGLSSVTLLLYFAVSLGVQQAIVQSRAVHSRA